MAVVHDLQKNAPHVLVGLLDLVKEHHAPGLAPHLLRQLSPVLIAHIARGRADEPAHRVLLHVLGHIQADHGVLIAVDRGGQGPAQLRLAHAGGAQEQEAAHRAAGVLQAHPAAADGPGHGADRLVLADDALLQLLFQALEPLALALVQRAEGDLRPQGHHLGHIRRSDRPPAALHMDGSRRLIQQVDGLIRQKAVVDIAHGKLIGRCQGLLIQADPMVLLQGGPQALEHFHGLLPARLRHLHRLEAPLQGRVLLDMAAVFLRRGGTDDLHLPPPKSGL